MNKKLSEIANIKFCLAIKGEGQAASKILTPINLLEENIVKQIVLDNKQKIDESSKIFENTIIIKRISPSFINYIEKIDDDVYAGGNLILVNDISINPKYLAYVLNKSIKNLTSSLTGAVLPAIGRNALENLQIPIPPLNQQELIGELWYKSIELKKLKRRLNDLEHSKHEYIINKIMID